MPYAAAPAPAPDAAELQVLAELARLPKMEDRVAVS